jgi:hypothetical protein
MLPEEGGTRPSGAGKFSTEKMALRALPAIETAEAVTVDGRWPSSLAREKPF